MQETLTNPESEITAIEDIPTPFMLINAQVVKQNIQRLAAYAQEHGLQVRPHSKTHKSLRVGRWQLDAGAIGLTVAKVGEGEVMAEICRDMLLAYPVVDKSRCRRAASLAGQIDLKVAIDSSTAAEGLGAAARTAGTSIGILVDMDVGLGRTGLQRIAQTLELAQQVDTTRGLRLDGLFIYPGHVRQPMDDLAAVTQKTQETLDQWQKHGLCTRIVSGGSTPTAYHSHRVPQTEIRPGTYIFNDINTVTAGCCALDDCAARLVCTVVSDAVPGQVVIDAGTKTLTGESCPADPDSGQGHVVEYPQARIKAYSEEHGLVNVRDCPSRPQIGQRVTVVPNHICVCVNLQDRAWLDHGNCTAEPLPIDTRGRLS